jgi:hypothetical protein
MNREEIWKDILGYEGFYQVSNLGRVRSVDRIVKGKFGSIQHKKGVMLAPAINTAGYYSVALTKNAKGKAFRVHRLVAEAFIPNPSNYPIINHKDENKLNNNVNNLEWCTYSYNTIYNNSIARRLSVKNKNRSYGCEKKVYQYNIDGHLIKTWKSLMEVSRELHVPWGNIANCCRGGKYRHTAYGYKWSYKPINTLQNES